MSTKRANGQYYTTGNPFRLRPFRRWAAAAGLPHKTVLEPFAGANHIIRALQSLDTCREFASFDIAPNRANVRQRNTIESFPRGYEVCVTNPPWLARNSATRRGFLFPECRYDDLYKHCLELCLRNCKYVAALIPASFLRCRLFRERLQTYILLHDMLFSDTENPVCLTLFGEHPAKRTEIYYDDEHIGTLAALERLLPGARNDLQLRFNDPAGRLGFISFDNTREPSIRFCDAREIEDYPIKGSSRFITRISGNFDRDITRLVGRLNRQVTRFRAQTRDVFLTPFKGMRADGAYRRRMDYALTRRLISATSPPNGVTKSSETPGRNT